MTPEMVTGPRNATPKPGVRCARVSRMMAHPMNRRREWIGLLAILLAGGCAINQSKEIELYRKELTLTGASTRPLSATEPLTLERALVSANEHNEQLSLEGENYLQALIDKRRAAAAFMPTVNLAPTYGWPDDSPAGGESVPLVGRMNVFNGFRDIENLKRSAATIEQRRALLVDLQAAVLLDTAGAYYRILRAERSVDVLRNSLRVQEERVRDMRGRQVAGVARPLDVAQTEARASAARVALLNAQNDVRNGRTSLELLIAAPVAQRELNDALVVPSAVQSLQELQEHALKNRLDYLASQSGIIAARHGVEVAVGQYYPSVSLNLNVFLAKADSSDSDWTALLAANLPIFSAGLIEADVRTAWSRYRQSILAESLTRRRVSADVQTAYEDLLSSGRRLQELRTQVAASDEAFRQADQSYNVGLATNLERLVAQDTLLTAQLQLTSEQYDHKVFFLNLLRVAGRLNGPLALDPIRSASTQPATRPASQPGTLPATTKTR